MLKFCKMCSDWITTAVRLLTRCWRYRPVSAPHSPDSCCRSAGTADGQPDRQVRKRWSWRRRRQPPDAAACQSWWPCTAVSASGSDPLLTHHVVGSAAEAGSAKSTHSIASANTQRAGFRSGLPSSGIIVNFYISMLPKIREDIKWFWVWDIFLDLWNAFFEREPPILNLFSHKMTNEMTEMDKGIFKHFAYQKKKTKKYLYVMKTVVLNPLRLAVGTEKRSLPKIFIIIDEMSPFLDWAKN